MENTLSFLKQYGIMFVVGLVGIGSVIYGLWGEIMPSPAVVEIVKSESIEQKNKNIEYSASQIVVDVAGAVEQPGVYTLQANSRIGDALVAAGGLSVSADREWVAQTLNLAAELGDGEKIYIPARQSMQASEQISERGTSGMKSVSANQSGKVNVNTASVSELDKLEGIGEVRAQAIVANRPYGKTEEIVTRAKVPQSVYDKIKDSIAIY